MKFSEIELPSNRKFGFFFSLVFILVSLYLLHQGIHGIAYVICVLAIIFLFIALFKAEILLPLNKLWMMLGFILGLIVSPIVLGIIFFGLFTPVALLMSMLGRDELRLKLGVKSTHWVERKPEQQSGSFKNQF